MYWNSTITVINKSETAQGVTYNRTVLSGCFVKRNQNLIYAGGETQQQDNFIIRIPKNNKFKTVSEYNTLVNKSGYFTLAGGDIIIMGNITDDINEYVAGKRINDIMTKYADNGVCKIKTVNVNCDLPNPHYHIIAS